MAENIEIHGVPMDLGANLRGVDMGPSALRIAGVGRALEALGYVVAHHSHDVRTSVSLPVEKGSARYLNEIVAVCRRLHDEAAAAKGRGSVPIFLGGDHSIAIGTVSGVATHFRSRGESLGLIWFDAHTDMNTPETSPSGNVHGMPLASLLGYGDDQLASIGGKGAACRPENVFIIGARDVDPRERDVVARSGVTVFSMREIDELGIAEVTRRAIEGATDRTSGFHLSFDIDGLDPEIAPGVGTPVRGGVNFREAHLMMELIADSEALVSMDVVELNPVRDVGNRTAETTVHLVQSAFGRSIL